jgi:Zn-dependent protease
MGLHNIDIGLVILKFVVFIFSLTLHEFGHAWTSEKFGDPTGRYMGRITLNPIAHMDPVGTVLMPIIGAVTGIPVLGWAKPVPVNPLLWRDKVKANIAVSAAGPIANLIIAFSSILIFKSLNYWNPPLGSFEAPVYGFLLMAIYINVGLAVFNMLPIPPLDGSHIFSSLISLVSPDMAESYETIRPFGMIILPCLVLGTRLLDYIFNPVMNVLNIILKL